MDPGNNGFLSRFSDASGDIYFTVAKKGDILTSIGEDGSTAPNSYHMGHNYPDPFNAETSIRFVLPEAQNVTFSVFDVNGRRIYSNTARYETGNNQFMWNGKNEDGIGVASGFYIAVMYVRGIVKSEKLVCVK